MSADANNVLFFLGEATLTLYPADAAGAPRLDAPVWLGACASGLSVRERWLKKERTPTGRRHTRHRPIKPVYEITIDRVWVLPRDTLADVALERGDYVLDVLWFEQDEAGLPTGLWHRETFYGVTISERTHASEEVFHVLEHQTFDADYYTSDSGSGTPSAVSAPSAFSVWWVEGAIRVRLYNYNTTSHNFTAAAAGVTTGRATVGYTPDQTGYFAVQFAGDVTPALKMSAAPSVLQARSFKVGSPTAADVPRVEFFNGTTRVLAVSRDKKIIAQSFTGNDTPVASASQFQFFSASALAALAGASGLTFTGTINLNL